MANEKNLDYWKKNAEEDYMQVPISVLGYITELESRIEALSQHDVSGAVCEIEKEFDKCPLFKTFKNGCYGCKYRKQTVH